MQPNRQADELSTSVPASDCLYDPRDPATVDDPFPAFRRLRDEAAVYQLPDDPVWVLSRFADIEAAMLDWQTFSSAKGNMVYDDPRRVGRTMTTNDPPRHDALRRLVGSGYTPGRVKAHEGRIRDLVANLIDRIDLENFDFITQFASPLTGGVIGSLIGVPEENLEELRIAVDEAFTPVDGHPEGRGLTDVFEFMMRLIEVRRNDPRDDMLTAFLKGEENGVPVGDVDVAVLCGSILGAGFLSTAHQMGNIMLALQRTPEQRQMLLDDPSLTTAAIEEGLRHDVSTMSFARQTTRDVELHGVTIPANSRVMLLLSSANRDERKIEDPESFRIDRANKRHISFSTGIHHCLGSSLARLEMRIAFEQLLPRLGHFELDLDRAERVNSLNFRGFRRLPTHARP
ncbi:cytochrome P450 [Sphingobium sp.]|uniref:cytochrome P450 n=1 Tax=Sphingobium sp. TaxID=1912891 RepID=UPI0028BEBF7B|nr:cytochrome P450 [Sphingobium sp.]